MSMPPVVGYSEYSEQTDAYDEITAGMNASKNSRIARIRTVVLALMWAAAIIAANHACKALHSGINTPQNNWLLAGSVIASVGIPLFWAAGPGAGDGYGLSPDFFEKMKRFLKREG